MTDNTSLLMEMKAEMAEIKTLVLVRHDLDLKRVDDHEKRIRFLESSRWKALGGVAAVSTAASLILPSILRKFYE